MKKKHFIWIERIVSALILIAIEAKTNINQEIFNAISFIFEEPNLQKFKPLFVILFLILEWAGIMQLIDKVIKRK